jgi:hypothetical protein
MKTRNLKFRNNFIIWIIRSKGEVIGSYGRNFQINKLAGDKLSK